MCFHRRCGLRAGASLQNSNKCLCLATKNQYPAAVCVYACLCENVYLLLCVGVSKWMSVRSCMRERERESDYYVLHSRLNNDPVILIVSNPRFLIHSSRYSSKKSRMSVLILVLDLLRSRVKYRIFILKVFLCRPDGWCAYKL